MKLRKIFSFLIMAILIIVTCCPTIITAASTCTVSINSVSFSKSTFNKGDQGTAYITTNSTGSVNYSVTYALTYRTTDGVWHSAFKKGSISACTSTTSSVSFSVPTSPSNINCISAVWQIESNPNIQLGSPSLKTVTATVNQTPPVISFSPSYGEVTPGSTKITISATQDGSQSGISRIQSYWMYNGSKYDDSTDYYANIYKQVPSSLTGKTGTVSLYAKAINTGNGYSEKTSSYTLKLNDTTPPEIGIDNPGDKKQGDQVQVTASDSQSGLKSASYSWDSQSYDKIATNPGNFRIATSGLTIGRHTVYIKVINNANLSAVKNVTYNIISNGGATAELSFVGTPTINVIPRNVAQGKYGNWFTEAKVKIPKAVAKDFEIDMNVQYTYLDNTTYKGSDLQYTDINYGQLIDVDTYLFNPNGCPIPAFTKTVTITWEIKPRSGYTIKGTNPMVVKQDLTGAKKVPVTLSLPSLIDESGNNVSSVEVGKKYYPVVTIENNDLADFTKQMINYEVLYRQDSSKNYASKFKGSMYLYSGKYQAKAREPIILDSSFNGGELKVVFTINENANLNITGNSQTIIVNVKGASGRTITLSEPGILDSSGNNVQLVEPEKIYTGVVTVENLSSNEGSINYEIFYSKLGEQTFTSKLKKTVKFNTGKNQVKTESIPYLTSFADNYAGGKIKLVWTIDRIDGVNIVGSPQEKIVNVAGGEIDKTPPTITLTPSSGQVASGGKITIEASDPSGISDFKYGWEGAPSWSTASGTKVEVTAPTVAVNTTKKLYVWVTDKSANKNTTGNNKYYTFEITPGGEIDKTPPTITLTPSSGQVASGGKITIEASDPSGISDFKYGWEGAPSWSTASGTKVEVTAPTVAVNTTKKLYVWVTDKSANKNTTGNNKYYTFEITPGPPDVPDGNGFKDVPKTHWAYNEIMKMAENGIINGYTDGTFRPENAVTRAEFAKIMVLALELPLQTPSKSSFLDLAISHWASSYVETAKSFLTGYKVRNGMVYKPDVNAMREDVAVALVKAKGYENDNVNESEIDSIFKDANMISKNLRKYVLIAKKRGMISGDPNGYFRPQQTLTRAEAAKLLYQIIKQDEKIVID